VRRLGLVLPPERMPMWRNGTVLKRWRYVGVYTRDLMLCVGSARIGPVPRRWWAVALPDGRLHGDSSIRGAGIALRASSVSVRTDLVQIELQLEGANAVETASPTPSGAYIWTAKRAGAMARGSVVIEGARYPIDGPHAFIDDSAGYHARHTAWKWAAGLGRLADGRAAGWNLVTGVHDDPAASERTLWLDGQPRHLGPARFAPDLSEVAFAEGGRLAFSAWSTREENLSLLLVRSSYRQPFGSFAGELAGEGQLAEGYGVMEDHDVWW
jgi:hypothetical protein